MEKSTRRNFLLTTLATAASAVGCALGGLPTNVAQNFTEGEICTNEELINMQKIGLLGESYFAIPLNTKERILNGGEPSFALIPESKSRISIKKVGVKGGEVIVDAPEGDLYLPYAYTTDGIAHDSTTDFSQIKPVRLLTNFKMKNLKRPNSENGKISLEKMTERDLPFLDETLKTIGNQEYIINKAKDINYEGTLPIYFTKTPITVEQWRKGKDSEINILGETYLFSKGQTREEYFAQRGFTSSVKTKPVKIPEAVKTHLKQD